MPSAYRPRKLSVCAVGWRSSGLSVSCAVGIGNHFVNSLVSSAFGLRRHQGGLCMRAEGEEGGESENSKLYEFVKIPPLPPDGANIENTT